MFKFDILRYFKIDSECWSGRDWSPPSSGQQFGGIMCTLGTCRPTLRRHYRAPLGRHIVRQSVVSREHSVAVSVDTRSTRSSIRSTCGRHSVDILVAKRLTHQLLRYDQQSRAYQWTVGGISVDCRWYIDIRDLSSDPFAALPSELNERINYGEVSHTFRRVFM